MKKLFTLIAATMLCVGAQAQTVNINLKNGNTICYSADSVENVDFNETLALNTQSMEFVTFEDAMGSQEHRRRPRMGTRLVFLLGC